MNTRSERAQKAKALIAMLCSGATALSSNAAQSDDDLDSFEEQDFLFLLEEAYTQEKGEWQAGVAFDHSLDSDASIYSFDDVEVGAAGAFGFNDDSEDARFLFSIQAEW